MRQNDINRAVARATGETISEIARRGFGLLDPTGSDEAAAGPFPGHAICLTPPHIGTARDERYRTVNGEEVPRPQSGPSPEPVVAPSQFGLQTSDPVRQCEPAAGR